MSTPARQERKGATMVKRRNKRPNNIMVKKKMTFVISVFSESGAKMLRKTYERCGYEYVGHTKDDNVILLEFKDKDS